MRTVKLKKQHRKNSLKYRTGYSSVAQYLPTAGKALLLIPSDKWQQPVILNKEKNQEVVLSRVSQGTGKGTEPKGS